MIISRTPLRMSFVGGGSDIAAFYRENGGAVLSSAIDKYVFVTVNKKFDSGIRIAYSRTEEVASVADVEHKLVRAAMNLLGINGGVEITTIADIPSRGTGLGSSSSFTVALLQSLAAFCGKQTSSERLASDACRIEIEICGEPIGKQDQYAAAYGGLNLIEFFPDEAVKVSPVVCSAETWSTLESNLLLLYTGVTRSASALLEQQTESIRSSAEKRNALRQMVQLTYVLRDELGKDNLGTFGEILHENWVLKKSLASGISNQEFDDWYLMSLRKGALGGKILGAGAGGFLMLYAPKERHSAICHALPFLRPVPVRLERFGSQIIFYNPAQC